MAYTAPTPADLKDALPAFATVSTDAVQYWLTRAARDVDTSWTEGDYAYAQILLAAHLMASQGVTASPSLGNLPEGMTNVKSGSFSMSIDAEAVKVAVVGGYGSTRYGREFAALLEKNRGGARVTGGVPFAACDGFNGFAGPLPPYVDC